MLTVGSVRRPGFSWKLFHSTSTRSRSGKSARARSKRRLPSQQNGQATSLQISIFIARSGAPLVAARDRRVDARDEAVELGDPFAQELLDRGVRHRALVVEEPGLELDVRLDRVHQRRVAEGEDAAQVLLPHRGTDLSGRSAD